MWAAVPKMPRPAHTLLVSVPLDTEVVRLHGDLVTEARLEEDGGIVVHLDVRRRDWRPQLGLPRGVHVRWDNVRTVDVKELSCFTVPICYRVTFGDANWRSNGRRHYFGVGEHLPGIDLKRGVTTTTLRAAVLLAVVACVGLRSVTWLLRELFHVRVSKSALDRWLTEAAGELPDAEGMARRLQHDRPITEAHLDEIFPRGWGKGCVVVVKDEHGRLVATEELAERTKANVVAFLRKLQSWGLEFQAFFIDGCEAYRHAIPLVYPEAAVQYDYFHVIQNIWRPACRQRPPSPTPRDRPLNSSWTSLSGRAARGGPLTSVEHLASLLTIASGEGVAAPPRRCRSRNVT